MNEIIINAPAKINIGLNIINKREDGFHNLETVFYPISLSDTLKISQSDSLKFETNSGLLASEDDNIVLKAVRLLENKCSQKIKVNIYLEKHIPIGAGLGGGSSDGAAVLKALNKLYNLAIPEHVLIELALQLGSDVPFFIRSTPAYAQSRGEILTFTDFRIKSPILIVNPGIHISTKWAFQNINPGKWVVGLFDSFTKIKDIKNLKDLISNDFETVCLLHYPELNNIKQKMYSLGADFALMSGSGSSFFGIFPDLAGAKNAEENFKKSGYFTWVHQE